MIDPLIHDFHAAGVFLPGEREAFQEQQWRNAWASERANRRNAISFWLLVVLGVWSFVLPLVFAGGVKYGAIGPTAQYEQERYFRWVEREQRDRLMEAAERALAEIEATEATLAEVLEYRRVLLEGEGRAD